jgi:cytochrome d ubiquinol oxidase subunit I
VDTLLAARSQMALSLAFHILFAVAGMGMPALMALSEGRYLLTRDPLDREIAQRWAKGTAILFAVGAVSGTVLSFELGLLWPAFMDFSGPIVALPFSLEGFAFFFEAVLLGVYLYGWDRVGRVAHWLAGLGVLLAGQASAAFVVCANAWMNHPEGYDVDPVTGALTIRPWEAMLNAAAPGQVLHMNVAAMVAIGFAATGVHALYLRREPDSAFHRRALPVALALAIVAALAQPLTGHVVAEHTARAQPVKLAAAEAQWETMRGAPLTLLGWPDEATETTSWSIEIPYLLSILAFGDADAEVKGLKEVPPADRPPVAVVHVAYQVMLGLGTAMAGLSFAAAVTWLRRREAPTGPGWLLAYIVMAPAGLIAIEAGWTVTEVGRQPWVIYGVMRTADAVTPVAGIPVTLVAYAVLYAFLGVITVLLLRRQFLHAPHGASPTLPREAR